MPFLVETLSILKSRTRELETKASVVWATLSLIRRIIARQIIRFSQSFP